MQPTVQGLLRDYRHSSSAIQRLLVDSESSKNLFTVHQTDHKLEKSTRSLSSDDQEGEEGVGYLDLEAKFEGGTATLSQEELDPLFPDYSETRNITSARQKLKSAHCERVKSQFFEIESREALLPSGKIECRINSTSVDRKPREPQLLKKRSEHTLRTQDPYSASTQKRKVTKSETKTEREGEMNKENKEYNRKDIYWNPSYIRPKSSYQRSSTKPEDVAIDILKTPVMTKVGVEGEKKCSSRKMQMEYSEKIKRKNKERLGKRKIGPKPNDPVSRFAQHKESWKRNAFLKNNQGSLKEGRKLDTARFHQYFAQKHANFAAELKNRSHTQPEETCTPETYQSEKPQYDFYQQQEQESMNGVVLEDEHEYDEDSQEIIVEQEGRIELESSFM